MPLKNIGVLGIKVNLIKACHCYIAPKQQNIYILHKESGAYLKRSLRFFCIEFVIFS